jgi:hypothetical protein
VSPRRPRTPREAVACEATVAAPPVSGAAPRVAEAHRLGDAPSVTDSRLRVEARNVLAAIEPNVVFELSKDGGTTWRALTTDEHTNGVLVKDGNTLEIRAKKAALFVVRQGLRGTSSGIDLDKPKDSFAVLQFSGTTKGVRRYLLVAFVTLFRVADLTKHKWGPVPTSSLWIYDLSGPEVLSGKTSGGFDRLKGTLRKDVKQHDASTGAMFFLETPDDASVPRLCSVYVPTGVKLAEEVQTHTFFLPTPEDKKPYPWHTYFGGRFDAYLVGGPKRLLHQHGLRGKKSLFVMPMPNQKQYFSSLHQGVNLRRYLLEIIDALQRNSGITPKAKLGRCAASGYSRGGSAILSLVRTTLGTEFPELKEIYSLDGEPDSAKAIATKHAAKWLKADDRRLRVYVAKYEQEIGPSYKPAYVTGSPTTSGDAKEWSTAKTTYLYAPKAFWITVRDEEYAARGDSPYFGKTQKIDEDTAHSNIPMIMLTHALATSGFK